jgi:hypothetical protein
MRHDFCSPAGEHFESVAREWLKLQAETLTPGTIGRERDRLEDFIFPYLGKRPIAQIKAPELSANCSHWRAEIRWPKADIRGLMPNMNAEDGTVFPPFSRQDSIAWVEHRPP